MIRRRTSQALILAAGRGTRLGSLNEGRPKCLAPVAGRSILDRQLEALAASRITDVHMVLGFAATLLEAEATALGRIHGLRMSYSVNHEFATTNVLRSWRVAADQLRSDHVYLHGDTVIEPLFIQRLLDNRAEDGLTLAVDTHKCAEEEMKYVLAGNVITHLSKTIDPSNATGEFTGILHCPGQALPILRTVSDRVLSASDGSRSFFEAALQVCIDEGLLRCHPVDITGLRWREVDFPEDLAAANAMFGSLTQ